jgi:AraC-like DNA-binding protein
MRFHFVAEGESWLVIPGRPNERLHEGDLVLIPHGTGHIIADPPGELARPLERLEHTRVGEETYRLRAGGSGNRALIFCCAVEFDALAARALISAMPEVLLVRRTRARDRALVTTLDEMTEEVASPQMGSSTMMARLADIVIVRALRLWLNDNGNATSGWLAAMRDPKVGAALAAMHRQPGELWTVDSLARIAGMSRSVFSERFTSLLGVSPGRHVAQWRAQMAAGLLRDTRMPIAQIAEQLGYESDASFSRAFRRIMGEPPSAVRRNARNGTKR